MRWIAVTVMICWGASALAWEEPARGTRLRAALMDAIRPHAEWALGAPVQFVVHTLRREGDLAYASLYAQRPGGRKIDQTQVPMLLDFEGGDLDDLAEIQVLYRKAGNTWVAVHFSFGSTDVWFATERFCRVYGPVIAEFCGGPAE